MDFVDLRGSGVILFQDGSRRAAAPIEDFARVQAGFASCEEFRCIFVDFEDVHGFL